MRRKRVLLVDDSVVIRRSLTEALARTPEILVAGSASNGRIALMKIPLLRPDVVVLDMEMPEISGLETLSAIRAAYPTLPVIMISPSTGAVRAGLNEALALGAVSCVFKPALDAAHRRLAGAPRRGARREDPAVLPRAAVLPRDRGGADRRGAAARRRPHRGPGRRARDCGVDRRPFGAHGSHSQIPEGLSRADRDRPAHAADLYEAPRRAACRQEQHSRRRGKPASGAGAGMGVDCAGRFSHGGRAGR